MQGVTSVKNPDFLQNPDCQDSGCFFSRTPDILEHYYYNIILHFALCQKKVKNHLVGRNNNTPDVFRLGLRSMLFWHIQATTVQKSYLNYMRILHLYKFMIHEWGFLQQLVHSILISHEFHVILNGKSIFFFQLFLHVSKFQQFFFPI